MASTAASVRRRAALLTGFGLRVLANFEPRASSFCELAFRLVFLARVIASVAWLTAADAVEMRVP